MRSAVVLAMWCTLAARSAGAASIGVYSTADCSSCNLSIPQFQQATAYICFAGASTTPGFDQLGLSGAEFRVVGLPAGWIAQSSRAPAANVSVGDPFDGGANIAFSSAQMGECILLYTVSLIATSAANEVVLQVTQHATPSSPLFQCPCAIPWNPPINGSKQCVGGGAMFINSDRDCQVSSQLSTWSQVKQLYEMW